MKAQNSIKYLVVAWIGLVASQMAFAQGVGNLGSLPIVFPGPIPPIGWTVGSAAVPIPVVLDPLGQPWYKNFTGPNGGPFSYPGLGGPSLPVQEFLVVAPNSPAWTDWHEDVIGIDALSGAPDYGWSWANPTMLVNNAPAPGLTTSISGNNVSFFFNPIIPGDTVIIRKDLVYTGPGGALFTGTLAIHEYPTPEPGSIGLLSIGGLLALRRWRTAGTKSGSRM